MSALWDPLCNSTSIFYIGVHRREHWAEYQWVYIAHSLYRWVQYDSYDISLGFKYFSPPPRVGVHVCWNMCTHVWPRDGSVCVL